MHELCDDPNCAICIERERQAAIIARGAAKSPVMGRIKELIRKKLKRGQS